MRISPGINKITLLFPIVHLEFFISGRSSESRAAALKIDDRREGEKRTGERSLFFSVERAAIEEGTLRILRRPFTPCLSVAKTPKQFLRRPFLRNEDISGRREKYSRPTEDGLHPSLIIGNAAGNNLSNRSRYSGGEIRFARRAGESDFRVSHGTSSTSGQAFAKIRSPRSVLLPHPGSLTLTGRG